MKKFTLILMLVVMCMPQFLSAKEDPPLEFTVEDIEVYVGYTLDASQFLDNPANLPVTWHSSDESIFTVDENGVITGIAENMVSAWLEVSFDGNEDYWNTIAGMEPGVRVWVKNQYPLSIGDYNVTPANASDIWGGKMSFNPKTNTLTMSNVELNGDDIKWDHAAPLTIKLDGKNEVVNGSLDAQNLILTGGGSFKQNYILYADSLVIDSASLSIEVAFNTNSEMDYTFSINKLSIINRGHFYACITANEGNILGEYDHVGFVYGELNFGKGIDYIVSYYPPVWVRDALSEENVMSVWKKDMFNNAFFYNIDETYILLRGALEIGYVAAEVHVLPDFEPTEITFDDMSANTGKVAVNLGANDEITDGPDASVSLKTPVTITDEEIDDLLKNSSPSDPLFQSQLPGITIKLPAGKGELNFETTINDGWSLNIKTPGKEIFSWGEEMPKTNWCASYDNVDETLAHFFVRQKGGAYAPARENQLDDILTGVTIYSIKVFPAEKSVEALKSVGSSNPAASQKRLHNGQLLILRGDRTYTLTGAEIK